jgi:microcin C transport system ATP-binding protein
MIAMALANDPTLLIADEPTTALDVTIQAQILELLREKQRERNMAMLLITHDLDVVGAMADDIVVMEKGHVVETGTAREILESAQAPLHPHADRQPAQRHPGARAEQAQPVIETKDLRVHFPILAGVLKTQVGSIKAVDGVTLSIRQGETLGIVGESGSGKSTLGMALLRLLSAQGPITYLGQSIEGASPATLVPLRREMQVVFQDPFSSLSPRMTVGEIVGEGLSVHARELDAATVEARVIDALEMVSLDPAARHRFPHEFSGGQRQRVAVARALCSNPDLSSWMSRHPRSTCRFRRRSSTCCVTCRTSTILPTCSSAMT